MKEYRSLYDIISTSKEYELIESKEKQYQGLQLEIQHYYSGFIKSSSSNIWFFFANGIIIAVADSWAESVSIFGEEF